MGRQPTGEWHGGGGEKREGQGPAARARVRVLSLFPNRRSRPGPHDPLSTQPPAAISLSAPPPTPSAAPAIRVAPGGTHLLAPGAPDNAPPLYLTGLNWFGFENGHTFFDGLWAGESALTRDFEVVAWRIRLLGFNAIRVPFSFPDLDAPPSNISASPCTATTVESVAASVARAGWGGLGGGVVVPALVRKREEGEGEGERGTVRPRPPPLFVFPHFLFHTPTPV